MIYRYNDLKDETNSRKRAMEALKKTRLDITSSAQEEVSGDKFFFKKIWSYMKRNKVKAI